MALLEGPVLTRSDVDQSISLAKEVHQGGEGATYIAITDSVNRTGLTRFSRSLELSAVPSIGSTVHALDPGPESKEVAWTSSPQPLTPKLTRAGKGASTPQLYAWSA